jgi:hypothetical protein
MGGDYRNVMMAVCRVVTFYQRVAGLTALSRKILEVSIILIKYFPARRETNGVCNTEIVFGQGMVGVEASRWGEGG